MTALPYDLVVSCVLFRTDEREVQAMVEQVATIPLRTLLILVDNDPAAPAREQAASGVIRIWTGANIGYGRAQNIAFAHARAASLLHLVANTDIRFAGEDVAKLCAWLDAHPDVGLVSPRVRYPDGRLQHLCRLLPTPADLIGKRFFGWSAWGRRRNARYELKGWSYDREADVPFLSGCFMLLRRSVVERVGGFDPRFFLYWEDLDLSRRIHAIARTVFVPEVEIVHDYRTQQRSSRRLLAYQMRNAARYFAKWGWMVDRGRRSINDRTLRQLPIEVTTAMASGREVP